MLRYNWTDHLYPDYIFQKRKTEESLNCVAKNTRTKRHVDNNGYGRDKIRQALFQKRSRYRIKVKVEEGVG